MTTLSAFVITLNEEKNIERCLRSLSFADEIIVLDGGSRDATVSLAKRFTEKVFERKFDDFASQKNAALGRVSGVWALSVDADEEVSPGLSAEIRRIVGSGAKENAFRIRRRTRLFGKDFRFSGLQDDRPARLFRKGRVLFEGPVHERPIIEGNTGILKNELSHFSFQTIGEHLRRLQLYTSLEPAPSPGRKSGFFDMGVRPLARFFSLYFFKQGFRDGTEGWIYCVLSGYYEFIRRVKHWERNRSKEAR